MAPCERSAYLLVAQRLDGVEMRGFPSWVVAALDGSPLEEAVDRHDATP
jgi:hypothetical protein